ncbi:hypothetical protein PG2049B_0137 [Bifidobacterium pseudolongum subsp. globosum]|uniref:Uncharacterized protein n=1 Tax=Bifidobacterium pseudolongum subsp. globosum TaxID=1690 RepID=A0A4Q5AM60_9BIFI|nr:hypothetical protein [Bifidobacterium pseudolongum]RYQ23137.1 hypothetical protein PG2049B_0137 [Bifidobacterium pseudolongum subsp. globosum]RYQ31593.1 hypothetical protein PG2017B_0137 [Bifidobacterium pseudolongum subsp. globosum]
MKTLEEEYDQINDGTRTVESIEHDLSVKARLRMADALMAIAEELHQLNGPQTGVEKLGVEIV